MKSAAMLEKELREAHAEIEFLERVCESVLYSMVAAKAHRLGKIRLRQVAITARTMLKNLNAFCEYQERKATQ
jgi:hypothetical protein